MGLANGVGLDRLVTTMQVDWYRNTTRPIAAACVAALLCSGCDSHSSAPAAAGSTPKVSAAAVAPEPAAPKPSSPEPTAPQPESFTTTGPLVAEQQADISAERAGRIVEVAVQIGEHVQAGQLLARLDDRLLHAACDAQKAHIATAQAEIRDSEAERESARADLRRADALHEDHILSDENWEIAKFRLDETAAHVARFESEKAAAEAELASATVQLEQSRIVAPFSGVVGRSSARIDQQITPGQPLFWITAQSPLQVLFTVPETSMGLFAAGKALDLTTADYPGLHQAGRIFRVSPVVDPASGSVQVIGAVDHPSSLLKPGMTMQVRLAQ
jgi:RND family efflux transporter MFP subunit